MAGSAIVASSTAAELKFNRNPAIDVAADCLAAPRRNFEADSAAPWQRAPPLDHVQVAAVREAYVRLSVRAIAYVHVDRTGRMA